MDIFSLLVIAVFVLLALTVHEFAHAYIADKLGDPTPRSLGRVTLNPVKHLDPLGTAVFIFTAFVAGIPFGWAKPVVFNPYNLKNPKRDAGFVALAGPISNFLFAILAALLINFLSPLSPILILFMQINIALAIFNLIPIYPLDGFNVTAAFLPARLERDFKETAPYGQWILLLLIFTRAVGTFIIPIITFIMSLLSYLY